MTNIKIVKSVFLKDIFNINSILWNCKDTFNVNLIFFNYVTNMNIKEDVSFKRHL